MKLKLLFLLVTSFFLFNSVHAQDVPVNLGLAKGYLLGPGDEITGKVVGEEEYNFVATVNEDGMIEVPFAEKPVAAKCKTIRDLRSDLAALLAKYLKSPQLSLQMKSNSRPPATIYGEVRNPQGYTLMRKVTLQELLSFSGGATEDAGGTVQVFRTQQPMCTAGTEDSTWKAATNDPTDVPSRMYSLASVKAGREDANPIIYPGDVVVIDKAQPVYITGEVVSPQGVYIKEGGMSLSQAIAKVGGVKREAKTKNITIKRLKPNTKDQFELISANYDLIKKGTQKDIILQPYDIVEVDHAKDSLATSLMKIAVGGAKTGVNAFATSGGLKILY